CRRWARRLPFGAQGWNRPSPIPDAAERFSAHHLRLQVLGRGAVGHVVPFHRGGILPPLLRVRWARGFPGVSQYRPSRLVSALRLGDPPPLCRRLPFDWRSPPSPAELRGLEPGRLLWSGRAKGRGGGIAPRSVIGSAAPPDLDPRQRLERVFPG